MEAEEGMRRRGMMVEAARQCAKDRKEWRALVQGLFWYTMLDGMLQTTQFRSGYL